MKKIFSIVSAFVLFALFSAQAQTITFDTDDYKAVSVYDAWEGSPFRAGELKGNAAVVNNHLNQVDEVLGEAPDATEKILAVQRSRFGGNLFGVRIDLKEPFRLTKNKRYAHVMINKPVESRVMVIGLGKRTEEAWSWQDGNAEQFWAISNSPVAANKWVDVVVSFNGFSYAEADKDGIDIYSLVIVPDVRSAHADEADFACFIDQIVIDESNETRFTTESYAVNFDKNIGNQRSDRFMTSVGLTGGTLSPQTKTLAKDRHYYDLTTTTIFSAKAGDELTPTYGYNGTWMSSNTYIDFAGDGKFTFDINADGTPADGSDIVSYQFISETKTDSKGQSVANGNRIGSASPSFTLPAEMKQGLYRMRYKVDWDCLDPAGNTASGNEILHNGGGIVDVLLDIHGDEVKVSQGALNGEVLDGEGNHFDNYTTAYGQPFTIKMDPAPGFTFNGVIVKSGYGVDGEQITGLNPNYIITEFPAKKFSADGTLTLPAEVMVGGEVYIEGLFVEVKDDPTPTPSDKKTYKIFAVFPNGNEHVVFSDGAKLTAAAEVPADGIADFTVEQEEDDRVVLKAGDQYIHWTSGDNAQKSADQDGLNEEFDEDLNWITVQPGNTDGLQSTTWDTAPIAELTEILAKGTDGEIYNFTLRENDDNWIAGNAGMKFFDTNWDGNGCRTSYFRIEVTEPTPAPTYDTTTEYFTAEQLRAEVEKGMALIGILAVTTTADKYVTEAQRPSAASADGTLAGVRAPLEEEVLEVLAVEDGYVLRHHNAEEGEGYIGLNGNTFTLADADGATVWTILGPEEDGYGSVTAFDDIYSDIPAEVNEHMTRFIADGQYMNTQNFEHIGGVRAGTGAWSFSYVRNANYAGGDDPTVGVGTVLAPAATTSIFNLQGIRLGNTNARGIRIVGGKKVIK